MAWAIWILRLGVFGIFLGHGVVALNIKDEWLVYLETVGISHDLGRKIMFFIGCQDILIAIITLFRPWKPVLIYAIIWAFVTALIRPLSGESIWDFVERAGNWATPLALLLLTYKARNISS